MIYAQRLLILHVLGVFCVQSINAQRLLNPILDLKPRWLEEAEDDVFGYDYLSKPNLKKVTRSELPDLIPDGNLKTFKKALLRQLNKCTKLNKDKKWTFGTRIVTRKEWCIDTNKYMLQLISNNNNWEAVWQKAKVELEWYKSVGRNAAGEVLFTGYYSPKVFISKKKTPIFRYPIYQRPKDLIRVRINGRKQWRRKLRNGRSVRYYTRKQIDWYGRLKGRGLPMGFSDSLLDLFFLQIQGSGILEYSNGSKKFINYNGQNGRKYTAIGRVLKNEGVDRSYLTLQGLRRYFKERPFELDRVLPKNQSYVFFKKSNNGPYGNAGVKLSNGHSIATDYREFANGALGLVSTQKPVVENGSITDWHNFSRFMLNQDTGGAIKTPGRVDIYWGEGEYAELAAGNLAHQGELYFALLPPIEILSALKQGDP